MAQPAPLQSRLRTALNWAVWSSIKSEGMPDPSALARLLDEWMHGDETEQHETFEVLRRLLDEDRPEGYKLFS